MAPANPISAVRNLAAGDAAIVDHARLVIARSLEILRECQPGTFLGGQRCKETSCGEAQRPGSAEFESVS
ncbi:hypothetical protein [Bradyrhizobium embrapense]|uniref:hypothetical protein n=1 Tax=Bradyrhizobium embrapense TaxID=630921 RepID=UPI000ACB4CC5|nr:hypothetical protein [Bradyrhizobium embrapense]